MLYLKKFRFASGDAEFDFLHNFRFNCYDSFYPFNIFPQIGLKEVEFEPITIFYGGNGSGKTTALNAICEYLGLKRDAEFNKTEFFKDYIKLCDAVTAEVIPVDSKMLTSDGVFDGIFNVRAVNDGIDRRHHKVFEEYEERRKVGNFQYRNINDFEELKETNRARRMTISSFTRAKMGANLRQFSNGENGFLYFTEKICDNSLFILDEPENSLSPSLQTELAQVLEQAARFFECQFIISTHSPFLLAMKGAKIYDLDESPVKVKRWTELECVKVYRELFLEHEKEFKDLKTLIFNGSPRANGDTAQLIDLFISKLKSDYKIVNAYNLNISPCLDCRYCWENNGCCIDDKMQEIYDYIQDCDNILFASPIYFSELTGPLLSVCSRLQSYFCAKHFRNEMPIEKTKKGAVILVGGGDGNMYKAFDTACCILKHMNCNKPFRCISYHNTNSKPAIENESVTADIDGIIDYFHNNYHEV